MNRYEILLLTVPHMTEDESGVIERAIEKIAKNIPGSTLLSYDKWGKCKLAYEIKAPSATKDGSENHEYGLYFLIRFELTDPKRLFDEVHALLTTKHNDLVIRLLTKKLDPKEPLVYQRTEVVEESTRDVGDFLRRNKMEGLLSSVDGERSEGRGERSDRGDRPRYSSFNRRPRREESFSSSEEKSTVDASEGI